MEESYINKYDDMSDKCWTLIGSGLERWRWRFVGFLSPFHCTLSHKRQICSDISWPRYSLIIPYRLQTNWRAGAVFVENIEAVIQLLTRRFYLLSVF